MNFGYQKHCILQHGDSDSNEDSKAALVGEHRSTTQRKPMMLLTQLFPFNQSGVVVQGNIRSESDRFDSRPVISPRIRWKLLMCWKRRSTPMPLESSPLSSFPTIQGQGAPSAPNQGINEDLQFSPSVREVVPSLKDWSPARSPPELERLTQSLKLTRTKEAERSYLDQFIAGGFTVKERRIKSNPLLNRLVLSQSDHCRTAKPPKWSPKETSPKAPPVIPHPSPLRNSKNAKTNDKYAPIRRNRPSPPGRTPIRRPSIEPTRRDRSPMSSVATLRTEPASGDGRPPDPLSSIEFMTNRKGIDAKATSVKDTRSEVEVRRLVSAESSQTSSPQSHKKTNEAYREQSSERVEISRKHQSYSVSGTAVIREPTPGKAILSRPDIIPKLPRSTPDKPPFIQPRVKSVDKTIGSMTPETGDMWSPEYDEDWTPGMSRRGYSPSVPYWSPRTDWTTPSESGDRWLVRGPSPVYLRDKKYCSQCHVSLQNEEVDAYKLGQIPAVPVVGDPDASSPVLSVDSLAFFPREAKHGTDNIAALVTSNQYGEHLNFLQTRVCE